MRKVVVLASASGNGKTTLGTALAERMWVPFVELDELNHGPNWTEATADELRARLAPFYVVRLRTPREVEPFLEQAR